MPAQDGAPSETTSAKKKTYQPQQGPPTQNFTKFVERTVEAVVQKDDTEVEHIRKILQNVRQEYDSVHHEAEQKEARLKSMREAINSAERMRGQKEEEQAHLDEKWKRFEKQYKDTMKQTRDTKTSRKVYEHMLARIQKEQAILKQKMLKMEDHLKRKRRDWGQRIQESDRLTLDRVANTHQLDLLEEDKEAEREVCRSARQAMRQQVEKLRKNNKQKAEFEGWRHRVALEAANAAFNASAGRLRKLYAIEKLSGNVLQKTTFEQVERSQNTEDGFQKIREVTGLTDVMDIVHKFLNRDVEQEQLKGSVKDAEVRLEALRQDFDAFKRDTEGITFDASCEDGGIYKEMEKSERTLNEAMQEHEYSRAKLQRTTLQVEHMRRWAVRVGHLLSHYEEPVRVDGPADLGAFFRRLENTTQRFMETVDQQIGSKKIHRRLLTQDLEREHEKQRRDLESPGFLKSNCRVPFEKDTGRSPSRQGNGEDEPTTSFAEDRERCKKESLEKTRLADQPKRSRPKG